MSDDFLGFDFKQDFGGGDTGEGLAINFAYSVGLLGGERGHSDLASSTIPKFAKYQLPIPDGARHRTPAMAATAGQLCPYPRLVRWAFSSTRNEVRAFLGDP